MKAQLCAQLTSQMFPVSSGGGVRPQSAGCFHHVRDSQAASPTRRRYKKLRVMRRHIRGKQRPWEATSVWAKSFREKRGKNSQNVQNDPRSAGSYCVRHMFINAGRHEFSFHLCLSHLSVSVHRVLIESEQKMPTNIVINFIYSSSGLQRHEAVVRFILLIHPAPVDFFMLFVFSKDSFLIADWSV